MRRSACRALMLVMVAICAATLARHAPAHAQGPAWLGIYIDDMTADAMVGAGDATRVFVTTVVADTPASAAGLRWGDIIVEIDRRPAVDVDNVVCIMSAKAAGSALSLTILRDGAPLTVWAILAPWPNESPRVPRNCPPHLGS